MNTQRRRHIRLALVATSALAGAFLCGLTAFTAWFITEDLLTARTARRTRGIA